MIQLGLDFESHYDSEYSLSKMPTAAYIRDPRWRCLGAAVVIPGDLPPTYLQPENLREFFDGLPWDRVEATCHNASFDLAVLQHHYGHTPAAIHDTMLQARYAIAQGKLPPELRTNLAVLSEAHGLAPKGDTAAAVAAGGQVLADYAVRDIVNTFELRRLMHPMPDTEADIAEMTVRMATEPCLGLDRELLQGIVNEPPPEGVEILRSREAFAMALRELGIEPATKINGNGEPTYAFAKTDDFMRDLLDDEDPLVRALADLRLHGASTIERSRAQRFLQIGAPMPVPLLYAAAHTLRAGGCLVANTEVTVLSPDTGKVSTKYIVDVLDSDLVWDGEEFVAHEGVVYQGTQEVVSYAGITGTKTHPVFCEERETPVGLYQALQENLVLQTPRIPSDADVRATLVRVQRQRKTPISLPLWRRLGRAIQRHVKDWHERMPFVRSKNSRNKTTPRSFAPGASEEAIESRRCKTQSVTSTHKEIAPDCFGSQGAVHQSKRRGVQKLWRTRDSVPVRISSRFCRPRPRTFRATTAWLFNRSHRQQRALRTREPALGYARNAGQQQTSVQSQRAWCPDAEASYSETRLHVRRFAGAGEIRRNGRTDFEFEKGSTFELTPPLQKKVFAPVYDIINCGSRHRFVANGKLVHNSDGLNLQNLPARAGNPRLRKSLLAPEGHVLVVVDSSQIEPRVLAWLAGDTETSETYARGEDVYRSFGAKLYACDAVDIQGRKRDIAKAAVLALGYGQGAEGFQRYCARSGIQLTAEEAQRTVQLYRQTHPAVVRYWQQTEHELRKDGYLTMPDQSLITYPGLRSEGREMLWTRPAIFRKRKSLYEDKIYGARAVENRVQRLARDVVLWQTLQLAQNGWRTVLSVHDEAVLCVPASYEAAACEAALDAFASVPEWAAGLRTRGEVKVGKNYGVKG